MMTDKYGPWIALNPGDAVPDGRGHVQFDGQSRSGAIGAGECHLGLMIGRYADIVQYRRLIEPVRTEVVLTGYAINGRYGFNQTPDRDDIYSLTFTQIDGELPCETYTAPSGATIVVGMV